MSVCELLNNFAVTVSSSSQLVRWQGQWVKGLRGARWLPARPPRLHLRPGPAGAVLWAAGAGRGVQSGLVRFGPADSCSVGQTEPHAMPWGRGVSAERQEGHGTLAAGYSRAARRHNASSREAKARASVRAVHCRLLKGPSRLIIKKNMQEHVYVFVYVCTEKKRAVPAPCSSPLPSRIRSWWWVEADGGQS